MTLAQFTTLITTKWGDITSPKRLPQLDRDVANAIGAQLWQTTTIQTLTTGSNVFWYDLRYKKIGNIVFIDGYIQNKFAIVKPTNTVAVTIPDALYFAKTGQDAFALGFPSGTGTNVNIKFSTNQIILGGAISPDQKILINAHYQTAD